jgi:Fic family protein
LIELEREAWVKTWFPEFDRIRTRYQERQRSVPKEVTSGEMHDFVVQFTFDTNRIEGSTLSLSDTEQVVDRGISPAQKPVSDVIEAREHARLAERLLSDPPVLDLKGLLRWHETLFRETKPGIAGRLRDYEVSIRGSRYTPPTALEVRPMLLELLRSTTRNAERLHRVELAATFHHRFEYIHPFGDGNGRVGRLAMNIILATDHFPPLNVPFRDRRGYYHALERASILGDSRPFIGWFFRRYRAFYRRLLPPIRGRRTR